MSQSLQAALPDGYERLRLLAEGGHGIVMLARASDHELVALKLMRIREGANAEEALLRHRRLMGLTNAPGLLRIRDCGLSKDRLWLWESLDLADGIDDTAVFNVDEYSPRTLRSAVIETGPLSARAAADVGLDICKGLSTLHAAGLVHRDVKPGNLLRVAGKVVLGDYGLVRTPGAPFDFTGTEGFMPTEGNSDPGTDLFALGRTLYELWTGCDRLEFPTLPDRILRESDWGTMGCSLNQCLLRACSADSSQRYHSAEDFARDLGLVRSGRSPSFNRRRWIIAGALAVGVAAAAGLPELMRPRLAVNWRRLRKWAYLPQSWGIDPSLLDEHRGLLLQFKCGIGETVLYKVDLKTFDVTRMDFQTPFAELASAILHPVERTLWFSEGGRGRVWRLDPETAKVSQVGKGTVNVDTCSSAVPYWNVVTERLGMFGGYGHFAMHNWRWEFEIPRSEWVEVEKNDPSRKPWCRNPRLIQSIDGGGKLLLFGGAGNSTGQEGVRDPGFKVWTARWHILGDVWVLDLATGRWECKARAPGLELPNPYSAVFLEDPRFLLVGHQRAPVDPLGAPPELFVLRLTKEGEFEKAENQGEVPDGRGELVLGTLPGGRTAVAFHASGIYELTVLG